MNCPPPNFLALVRVNFIEQIYKQLLMVLSAWILVIVSILLSQKMLKRVS